MTRHAAHVEEIGSGQVGLFLGEPRPVDDEDAEGPEGWALMDEEGGIQWTVEDIEAGTFSQYESDPVTGAYILPDEE